MGSYLRLYRPNLGRRGSSSYEAQQASHLKRSRQPLQRFYFICYITFSMASSSTVLADEAPHVADTGITILFDNTLANGRNVEYVF